MLKFPAGTKEGPRFSVLLLVASLVLSAGALADPQRSSYRPQLAPNDGFSSSPLLTVSEVYDGYTPVGLASGIGLYEGATRAIVYTSHALRPNDGYPYQLANGTTLEGSRVSRFLISRQSRGIEEAGLAYDTVYDRARTLVDDPRQISETGSSINGFERFTTALPLRTEDGFRNSLVLVGERKTVGGGGTWWALSPTERTLFAVPELGRGAWTGAAALAPVGAGFVALLLADDATGSPLYLWLGQHCYWRACNRADRAGLRIGQLYAFVPNNGEVTPADFNGTVNGLGAQMPGTFQPVTTFRADRAGQNGWDDLGYRDAGGIRNQAVGLGAFRFTRPQALSTNPAARTQVAFSSAGDGVPGSDDQWGDVYRVTVNLSAMAPGWPTWGFVGGELVLPASFPGTVRLLHDADSLEDPDTGIRNPDNLAWGEDGNIYVQEVKVGDDFGLSTGRETSVMELRPTDFQFFQVAEIDRTAIHPRRNVTDTNAGELGAWVSTGIVDVSAFFDLWPGEQPFMLNTQAVGTQGGDLGFPNSSSSLGAGGQTIIFSRTSRIEN